MVLVQFFASLQIDGVNVDHALTRMDRDSQKYSVLSHNTVESNKYVSTEYLLRVDRIVSKIT